MIYLFLLALNILLLFFIPSEKKYAWVGITIWIMLIISFISWRWFIGNAYHELFERRYWSGEGMLKEMNNMKSFIKNYSIVFIHCISFQTLLTFIFQIIGYKKTKLKVFYKWMYFIFLALLLLNIALEVMLALVPSGPIV